MKRSGEDAAATAAPGHATSTVLDMTARMIDTWFPCPEVDQAVGTPAGSGRSEKALFTWFASRPIAQARAAVLCSLLPDSEESRRDVRAAILSGDPSSLGRLRSRVLELHGGQAPVVLDMFSGRGIIPLEAARLGASAVGTDLSPVATLAGRLLADYPLRDWTAEPPLPYESRAAGDDEEVDEAAKPVRKLAGAPPSEAGMLDDLAEFTDEPRLLTDVRKVLAEVARRVAARVAPLYGVRQTAGGGVPWGYLWAVSIPCDGCGRRFPLIGAMALRHPYVKTSDKGQALNLEFRKDGWTTKVTSGVPVQTPTFASAEGRRGKSARCPFPKCGHSHTLDVVKAKGFAGQYQDELLAVAEIDPDTNRKIFRVPRDDERNAADLADPASLPSFGDLSAVPDEVIDIGNSNTIQARVYGYTTYGALMNRRQAVLFATTVRVIDELWFELAHLVSEDYARALVSYAAANIPRQLRRSTRGANLLTHGNAQGTAQNRCQAGDVFSSQSVIKSQFDYFEAGPGDGPGTWTSVSTSMLNALRKVLDENPPDSRAARFRRASAVSLPFRDNTVDAVVTDPPYYDMITYADSSDLFHVWIKRALHSAMPDLFDGGSDGADGLQDKSDEIIVKSKGRRVDGEHRTQDFYEAMLARSFSEAKRVLKSEGHLTVIFGHSDPEAWKRLLTALTDAGFVVTSSWPSRTETAVTGVATISVTVSIGARVAPAGRPVGIAAQVDAEVSSEVKARCRGWDADGLALEDQLMASYGAALQVVGRFSHVITPDGATVPLEHYMNLSRRAVRDAIALRLDEQPLETFDPYTRLAVFWHETYGRASVPKGESRFFAQSDSLRLEDLRGPILEETKAGYCLRHDDPGKLKSSSSAYEVVRAMAAAQPTGTEAVSACLRAGERIPTDAHIWALVDWLSTKLPASDPVALSLASVKRNKASIQQIAAGHAKSAQFEQDTIPGETA